MSDLMKFFGVVTIAVLIPYAIIWGVYFDILPESLEVLFSMLAVIAAIVIIVSGNLVLMYQDIKTGRYKNQS